MMINDNIPLIKWLYSRALLKDQGRARREVETYVGVLRGKIEAYQFMADTLEDTLKNWEALQREAEEERKANNQAAH